MARRLPPLNALRAFEAAARHLSFTRAAEELNVTPAAVSHQVKALEAQLGRALFRRRNNGLALTREGAASLPLLSEGFDRLAEAGALLRGRRARRVLTVVALPSVAAKWLAPRLPGFTRAHPDIDLRIDASEKAIDFGREEAALAIAYGAPEASGLTVEPLFTDAVFPVCSPALIAGPPPLREPCDLAHQTLLHIDWKDRFAASPDWRRWLRAAGAGGIEAGRGPRFTLSSMAIQAAIDGQGVALGQHLFADDDIAAGRLARPFELSLPLDQPYCLVAPRDAGEDPAAAAFRDWLRAEAEAYRARVKAQGATRPHTMSAATPSDDRG